LQAVEDELKKDEKSSHKLSKKKEAATKKVAEIKSQLAELEFSDTEYDAMEVEKVEADASVRELKERIKLLDGSLKRRLEFSYTDPVRGFDRSKVKGLVANLIKVKDPVHATALEVVAGGKLF
jgi:structural maintenance of chromosome 2